MLRKKIEVYPHNLKQIGLDDLFPFGIPVEKSMKKDIKKLCLAYFLLYHYCALTDYTISGTHC